jgi:glucosamine kinase
MMVLGVDVGGSTMRVVLYDDDAEQERAEGVGSPMRLGHGSALAQAVAEAARPLLFRSRTTRADALVIGASGAGRSAEREELREALEAERVAWRVLVTSDAELARASAFEGGPGVLLIAGTGSIALARDANGEMRRVGGLGWRMGDQGSAYWIGASALEAVGAMRDGLGMVTHLAEAICTAAGVAGIAGLVRWSVVATPAQVAALAPAALACAARGDPVAIDIRTKAVDLLARLAVAAGGNALPVALSGGLLAPDRPLRELVVDALEHRYGGTVLRAKIDPCRGAPVLARVP